MNTDFISKVSGMASTAPRWPSTQAQNTEMRVTVIDIPTASPTTYGGRSDVNSEFSRIYAMMTMIIRRQPPPSKASRAGGTTPMMNPT